MQFDVWCIHVKGHCTFLQHIRRERWVVVHLVWEMAEMRLRDISCNLLIGVERQTSSMFSLALHSTQNISEQTNISKTEMNFLKQVYCIKKSCEALTLGDDIMMLCVDCVSVCDVTEWVSGVQKDLSPYSFEVRLMTADRKGVPSGVRQRLTPASSFCLALWTQLVCGCRALPGPMSGSAGTGGRTRGLGLSLGLMAEAWWSGGGPGWRKLPLVAEVNLGFSLTSLMTSGFFWRRRRWGNSSDVKLVLVLILSSDLQWFLHSNPADVLTHWNHLKTDEGLMMLGVFLRAGTDGPWRVTGWRGRKS